MPLFDDHFSILLDGVLIAYLMPKNNVVFLVPEKKLTSVVVADVLEFVQREKGPVNKHALPPMPPDDTDDDDEEENEDDE